MYGRFGWRESWTFCHGGELGEELAGEAAGLVFEAPQLGLEAAVALGERAQLLDPRHELDDGLLERQDVGGHRLRRKLAQ